MGAYTYCCKYWTCIYVGVYLTNGLRYDYVELKRVNGKRSCNIVFNSAQVVEKVRIQMGK